MSLEPLPLPQQIGKYKIEGLLTKGGMSLLYLGSHPDTQEPILVKVLLPKFLSEPEMCDRFLNEAQVIALTNHPNIITLYDYGRWEGGLYIAMEFVKGSSLRKLLAHQPFSLKRALEVLLQIAYALCHLHSHGVIHGDLKPENILINEQGQVKVIDFGIAKLLTEKNEPQTTPNRLIGTPIYMSPEQHLSHANASFQSDIYSLGIVAYELAMGKISHGRVIISLAPRGLQKILHKALQPAPDDRYPDMVDFIADLSQYIKSGTFQKDTHGSDYFLELFEKLETFQNAILPAQVPQWEGLEIGHVLRQGMGLSGLYFDFFDLKESKKGILIAEAETKGAEGVLLTSMLRTAVRTLLSEPLSATLFFEKFQKSLKGDFFEHTFLYAFLIIDTKTKSFECFQRNYGKLLHSSSIKEKIDWQTTGTLSQEDRLLLVGANLQGYTDIEAPLEEAFRESLSQTAQSQAEMVFRKLRLKAESLGEETPLCLITIRIE